MDKQITIIYRDEHKPVGFVAVLGELLFLLMLIFLAFALYGCMG